MKIELYQIEILIYVKRHPTKKPRLKPHHFCGIVIILLIFVLTSFFKFSPKNLLQPMINSKFQDLNSSFAPKSGFHYTTKDWLSIFYQTQLFSENHYLLPPLCDIPKIKKSMKYTSNSSPEDCIITCYFQKTFGLFPLIRSFRTVGSKATIIIILDEDAYLSLTQTDLKIIKECGVKLAFVGKIPVYSREAYFGLRYFMLSDFLHTFQHYFKRCIVMDGFDVVFQGDPFVKEMSSDLLYLTQESDINNATRSWFTSFPQEVQDDILPRYTVNNGIIAGGTSKVLELIDYIMEIDLNQKKKIITFEDFANLSNLVVDQAYLNVVYYNGTLADKGIHPQILQPGEWLSSIYGEIFYHPELHFNFEIGKFHYKNQKYPSLIHHYVYHEELSNSVFRACPPLPNQSKYYIRSPNQ